MASAATLFLWTSCDDLVLRDFLDEEDVTAPIPDGSVSVSNVGYNFFDISWPEAEDDWTPREDLEYAIYGSQFTPIETLAEAEVYAEHYRGWERGLTFISREEFPGAVDGLRYYINVFVRDAEGNTAAYGQIEVTPPPRYDIFVGGEFDVPRVYRNGSAYGETLFYLVDEAFSLDALGDDKVYAIADISGNGLLDVVTGMNGGPTRTYVNNGDWSTTPLVYLQELSASYDNAMLAVETGEFNGDGFADLLVVQSPGNSAETGLNTFSQFASSTPAQTDADWLTPPLWGLASSVAVADLDADGLDDVILGTLPQVNVVYRNIGDGLFRSGPTDAVDVVTLGDAVDNTYDLIVAPITVGDEIPDVLAINDGDTRLDIGIGDGQTFIEHTGALLPTINARSGAIADLDGDGDLDLALGRNDSVEIEIYLNVGIGEDPAVGYWQRSWFSIDLPGVSDTERIAAADLDGDGDPDLVAISELDQVLMVWSNEGGQADDHVEFEEAIGFPVSLAPMRPTQLQVVPLVP